MKGIDTDHVIFWAHRSRWHGKSECPYNAGETNDFVSARWFLQDKAIFVLLYAGNPET
jgi:hypothetical protein